MLQRTASSAYTWWWASQIRTKQSKWLDNDLQEMEERVKFMIKLVDEDADSFAKKAEMYFRRRPELISSVEEAYRAYKAMADRYDRISGELHKANHIIATAFPDQVPMMEDDDHDGPLKTISSMDLTKLPNPPPDLAELPKPPPELPRFSSRIRRASTTRMLAPKRPRHKRTRSHITAEQAQEEIDKLQKRILVLQTEKEFFKSSYQCGLTKYWDIERQMIEMQEVVSELQDEFNAGSIIEDDEARALMAATAIKSCEDTLVSLHEKQKRSSEEASIEHGRIKVAKVKLRTLRGEETGMINDKYETVSNSSVEEEVEGLSHERLELQSICDKVKDLIQMSSESSVAELVEKIDSLVEKVISLEITVSSQTAQILRLKAETDELHKHLRDAEEDKKNKNVDPNSLNQRLTQVVERLQMIQDLERSVQNEKGVVRSHFAQACTSLNDLSEKLQSPTKKGQLNSEGEEKFSNVNMEPLKESKEVESADQKIQKTKENSGVKVQNEVVPGKIQEDPEKGNTDQNNEAKSKVGEDEDGSNWQQLLASGLEGKDKILLYEYTSILRNYKDTRKRLTDMEKRNQECHSETMQQIQELRCANAIKDEEIKTLRRKLFSAESLRRSTKPTTTSDELPSNHENSQKSEDLGANTLVPAESEALSVLAEDEVKICDIDHMFTTSPLAEKFRGDIDTLLEENLDFWLRFSTSYHQIQKFSPSLKELKAEAEKVIESKNAGHHNDSSSTEQTKSDSLPTDKKLREFNTELQVWLEHNGLLQGELRCRSASLCNIQEEITSVTKSSEGEDAKFSPYQAAKFQGEVINMQQENNKVAKELQAGLDHVKGIQAEVGKALSKLHEKFELSSSKAPAHYNQFRHLSTRSRVPLKAFLFAAKPKKTSIFACMNPVHHHHKQPDVKSGKLSKAPH